MKKLILIGLVAMCLVAQAATLNGVRINNDTSGTHTIGTKVTITSDTNVNAGTITSSNLTVLLIVGADSSKKLVSSTLTVTEANALHNLGAAASQAALTITSNSLAGILICWSGTNLTIGDLIANTLTINSTNPGSLSLGGSDTNHTILLTNTSDHLIIQGAVVTPINTISSTVIDWTQSNTHFKSISGDTIFTFSNAIAGQWITVAITAAATNAVTWPTTTWKAGSTPTQTSSKTDFYRFYYNGTIYYGEAIQNF